MFTKRVQKKLDMNYTKMIRALLNKSWKQHPTKSQMYAQLPLISKTVPYERDMWDTAGVARMNFWVTYFDGTLHMDASVLADHQELVYINSVR